jgi:hypothetical protein
MNLSIKTREILLLFFLLFLGYAVIILLFAAIYHHTGCIGMTVYDRSPRESIDFGRAVYFSIVTFHTIGYGDIRPISDQGRLVVMIQSSISLPFTAIFSGLLIYFIIKRPRDIFITKKIYIRHRNGKFWLSVRMGNKGRAIIDVVSKFEVWTIVNNSRVRIFQKKQELPDLERILYLDIPLDAPENHRLENALRDSMRKKMRLHVKFSFVGNDMRTGEQVAFAKYYDSADLRFGNVFQNVYSWDTSGRRKDFTWKNFEKIGNLSPETIGQFMEKGTKEKEPAS